MKPDDRDRIGDDDPWLMWGGLAAAAIAWIAINFLTAWIWFSTYRWVLGK